MTDAYEPDDREPEPAEPSPRDLRHKLAEQTRETNELRARLEATERDAAFDKALGPNDHPGIGYFKDGYKGEVNPEAIRAAAAEAGFLATDKAPPPDTSAYDRIANASAGANAVAPDDLASAIAAANSEAEVMALLEGAQGQAAGLRTTRQNQ